MQLYLLGGIFSHRLGVFAGTRIASTQDKQHVLMQGHQMRVPPKAFPARKPFEDLVKVVTRSLLWKADRLVRFKKSCWVLVSHGTRTPISGWKICAWLFTLTSTPRRTLSLFPLCQTEQLLCVHYSLFKAWCIWELCEPMSMIKCWYLMPWEWDGAEINYSKDRIILCNGVAHVCVHGQQFRNMTQRNIGKNLLFYCVLSLNSLSLKNK